MFTITTALLHKSKWTREYPNPSRGYAMAATAPRVRQQIPIFPVFADSDGVLFGVVHYFLCIRWSPEQIALTLAHTYPKGHEQKWLG